MKIFNTGVPPLYDNGTGVYISNFTARPQKNDQNSYQWVDCCTVINRWINNNGFAQNPCSETNTVNNTIHNYLAMNCGGAAW